MNEPIVLNKYGLAVWKNNHLDDFFIERSYQWVDRILIIQEIGGIRQVVSGTSFTGFSFNDWTPVTVEEYSRVKLCLRDIYDI